MSQWRPQRYRQIGDDLQIDPSIIANAVATAEATVAVADVPVILTLKHLAYLSRVDYRRLRATVERDEPEPYRTFRLKKRRSYLGERRFRVIAVPAPHLLQVQRWIASRLLKDRKPHPASVAYSKGDTILAAAAPHCENRWLIKLDVRSFFESVGEISVYRVFRSMGYQPLVAFELTRICTRVGSQTKARSARRWRSTPRATIRSYGRLRMGHLPQGAPTSPMLSNLASKRLDEAIAEISHRHGMVYTRYADDLTLSTRDSKFTRRRALCVIGEIYEAMRTCGFAPNVAKAQVVPPGARKVVLGLLVDGPAPRLTREFRANMRRHIFYLTSNSHGASQHARARGFRTISGMRNHLYGLVSFAKQIEPTYGGKCEDALAKVEWPV